MKTVLPVLVLLISAVFCTASDILLNICPRIIRVGGGTKTFQVSCSFKSTNTSEISKLTSLTIKQFFSGDDRSWVTRASVNESNHVTWNTGVAEGLLNLNETSYIILKVEAPRTVLAGKYVCEAEVEGGDGSVGVINASAIVRANKPTVSQMLEYYKGHHHDVLKMMRYNYDVDRKSDTWLRCCRAVQNSKNHVYRSSKVRGGKRYYLSPLTKILPLKQAEIQCRVMGGYLAEVDSADELYFIRRFLTPFTDYVGIFIAGSDEKEEDRWISDYSNTTVYLSWGSDQPNEERLSNCLCLWRDKHWRMADYKCSQGEVVHKMGYLCEVED